MRLGVAILAAALAAPAWGQDEGELSHRLQAALTARDAAGLKAAAGGLVRLNTEPAAKQLLRALGSVQPQDEQNYWVVVRALASFTSREALSPVAEYTVARKGTAAARDIMFMILGNEAEGVGVFLAIVIERGSEDLQEMAINHAASVHSAETVDPLINALELAAKRKKPDVEARIQRVLALLTGVDYGTSATNWRGWWEKNRANGLPKAGERAAPAAGGGTVVETLDPKRGDEFKRIKGPIVVIRGECKSGGHGLDHNYDHIDRVLAKMGIPHTVITKEQFEEASFKTDDKMVILINCHYWRFHCRCPNCYSGGGGRQGGKTGPRSASCPPNCAHDQDFYKMSDAGLAKLVNFVAKGGYLFTEDWQLEELLERAWGGLVQNAGYLTEQTVSVYPQPGNTSHPYLRRIFAKPPKPTGTGGTTSEADFETLKHDWKIDPDSPSIQVKSSAVKVLLVSPNLEQSNKGNGAVAITFKHMKGQVLHVLSHFGKQKSTEDEYALQNLMLNFILEASELWNLARQKK
jgi:hypothetical protein